VEVKAVTHPLQLLWLATLLSLVACAAVYTVRRYRRRLADPLCVDDLVREERRRLRA
jgi:hypothetical protein